MEYLAKPAFPGLHLDVGLYNLRHRSTLIGIEGPDRELCLRYNSSIYGKTHTVNTYRRLKKGYMKTVLLVSPSYKGVILPNKTMKLVIYVYSFYPS